MKRALVLSGLLIAIPGCTIPRAGGLKGELSNPDASSDYVVRRLDAAAVRRSQATETPTLSPDFAAQAPSHQRDSIQPGDRLSLTIIESTGGALPSAINGMLKLDLVDVQPDGTLAVPYAGTVPVAGQSIESARRAIGARLSKKLYRPQVLLRMVDGSARAVSVMGDVGKGGSYPLGPNMTRLSDLIGAAATPSEKPEQVTIDIRRSTARGKMTLKQVLEDPEANVLLQGGDVVSVSRSPRYVTVMGASATPGRVEITGSEFSVLDALAVSGGLDDTSADPSGVFVFSTAEVPPSPASFVVYEIDIRDPAQVQLARNFRLGGGDVIYVSTASFAQTRKVLSAISGTLSTASRIP